MRVESEVDVDVVRSAARRAEDALGACLSVPAVGGSREGWGAAITDLQRVIDIASAAQDVAMVRLAAIEPEVADDGTVREGQRALGHVALDAAALVSGALSVSSVHAERRVRAAVRMAADGPGAARATGLAGLHTAMGAGRLDPYRASVVADELEEAPVDVAAGVVAALQPYFDHEDAPRLRRRCRRVLARVGPDLLRRRARRARAESALRRWVDQPGVDRWEGTFPSEEAAQAWAAIDALAQRYLSEGVCERIDRARAKALTDLVEGNATIATVITLTVPAEVSDASTTVTKTTTEDTAEPPRPGAHPGDLIGVSGLLPGEPTLVGRAWLERAAAAAAAAAAVAAAAAAAAVGSDPQGGVRVIACDPRTGAPLDRDHHLSTDAYRPGPRLRALVRARDGQCRFPGCQVSARFCDLDHVRPWPAGRTAAGNLMCLCRRHHRIKQRTGWRVALEADGIATWTDPAGVTRATHPVDALHAMVLRRSPREAGVHPVGVPRTVIPDGPYTPLEFALEHRLGGRWKGCRTVVDLREPSVLARVSAMPPDGLCRSRSRSSGRRRPQPDDGQPPF